MTDVVTGIALESFALFARMAPYLILGIAVAGVLHIFLPDGLVARLLGGRGPKPAFRAALIGVPLPLCSCSVVPVAASLKRSGASKGATVSFLISTPTSGVDSIFATYSLLGGLFAVARVIASFVLGLVAGVLTSSGREQNVGDRDPAVEALGNAEARGNPVARALVYGFGDLLGGMARSLALGTLLGGAIATLLPPDLIERTIGEGPLSYLAMMAFGIPLYVCASGSIPLAAALLAKGISPGAALVFLITGPATNAATVAVISKLLGRRTLLIFFAVIGIGSIVAGIGLDALFAAAPGLTIGVLHHVHRESLGLLEILSGILLGLLIVFHLLRPYVSRFFIKKGTKDMFQLKVPDMTCAHCAGAVTKAAGSVSGVKAVHADPTTKQVEIDLADDTDTDAVLAAISAAGFTPETDG